MQVFGKNTFYYSHRNEQPFHYFRKNPGTQLICHMRSHTRRISKHLTCQSVRYDNRALYLSVLMEEESEGEMSRVR